MLVPLYHEVISLATWSPVPILMYHAVEKTAHANPYKHIHVTTPEFGWQMRSLKQKGYTPISFKALHAAMDGTGSLPERPVLLTFDDGYQDLYDNAHPLLAEMGFPYTVFLVTQRIGEDNRWVAPEGLIPFPLLSWDQIKQMHKSGNVSFQPHTLTHPRLSKLPLDEARREIAGSRETLEQTLGIAADVFCYPYGDFSDEVAAIVEELGFASAVTTQFGRVRSPENRVRLPRISIYHVPPISLTYGVATWNYWWRIETRKDTRAPAA